MAKPIATKSRQPGVNAHARSGADQQGLGLGYEFGGKGVIGGCRRGGHVWIPVILSEMGSCVLAVCLMRLKREVVVFINRGVFRASSWPGG